MVRVSFASAITAAAFLLQHTAHAVPLELDGEDLSTSVGLAVRDAPKAIPAGFRKQVFLENFAAGTKLDSATKWQYDLGHNYPGGPQNWGTGEIQRYTSDAKNIFINKAGALQIVPRKVKTTGEWTSARIETRAGSDFGCAKGGKIRVQASIRLGKGGTGVGVNEGFWPAFWLLSPQLRGNYQNWPSIGEIDILESVNGLGTAWQMAHCGTNPGGVCNEPNGLGGSTPMTRGAWHTLTLDIDRTSSDWRGEFIAWSVDGVRTRVLRPSDMQNNQAAWNSLAANKKFILLNVAVGGGFPNALANKPTPTTKTIGGAAQGMAVDYVVVWST